jgi:hypothetical protein
MRSVRPRPRHRHHRLRSGRGAGHEHKPRIIIAGGSAYSRQIDFARFRAIADAVDAILWVDMAHFAGLVAGGAHPSPFPHAHVATSTTHKTLRGPRGGIVLTNDEDIAKKINSAVFPGLQGGPLMHVIAAKAVAFGEALTPEFKSYISNVVRNAEVLAETLVAGGLEIVSGGTDTHLMLVDLRPKNLTGKASESALGRAFITCNKNGVPNDPEKPTITSGVRLGTPAGTTRGFGEAEFREIGALILEVLDGLKGQFGRRQRRGGSRGESQGDGADRSLPDLSASGLIRYALSLLRFRRQPGEGFAARRRRRRDPQAPGLPDCGGRFTTFERVQLRDLQVLKKTGRRVPFDRDKLAKSFQIALRKRPVDPERIDRAVSGIVRRLESSGERPKSPPTRSACWCSKRSRRWMMWASSAMPRSTAISPGPQDFERTIAELTARIANDSSRRRRLTRCP